MYTYVMLASVAVPSSPLHEQLYLMIMTVHIIYRIEGNFVGGGVMLANENQFAKVSPTKFSHQNVIKILMNTSSSLIMLILNQISSTLANQIAG